MRFQRILAGLIGGALSAAVPSAGIDNPDISAVGQVFGGITGDPGSPDREEPTLSLGESEILLEASLNPYLKGYFTVAAGEEGFGMEEAYATFLRGLPFGLGLKAGKYRLGLGKLNPVHPHAYPFLVTPRAWVSLLPGGEEGFNETAVQASILLPTPGDWASTLSAEVIEGAGFHPDEEATRLGWLGRWSNSILLGESAALEAGVSGATGMDNVAEDLRGYLAGGDVKVKFYLPKSSQLVLQGEGMLRYGHATDSLGGISGEDRLGCYAFADFRYQTRWNLGLLYDRADRAGEPDRIDRSVKAFTGYAVLEESSSIRLAYEYFMPDGEDGFHSVAVQLLFSMGPHKPHQF